MAMKAILITETNKQTLINKYVQDDVDDLFVPGYYIISDFGVDSHYEVITPEVLEALFVVGEAIQNGFVAVERR
jgi:hypothetical protein